MNFLDIRAGDNVEVGTQLAFRFWRYVFPPFEAPIRLLSWVSSKRWHPGQFVEGTSPDVGEHYLSSGGASLYGQAHRARHELRQSSRYRHRKHSLAQRTTSAHRRPQPAHSRPHRSARATDGDFGNTARHFQLAR